MASKHLVVCVQCGRQFDANRGAHYDPQTRRYTCRSCLKKNAGNARERSTGMRQSKGAMIAKLAFGAIFVISAFGAFADGLSEGVGKAIGALLVGLVLGAALIAWGLLPWLKVKRESEAAAARAAAEEFARKNALRKCPACGAMSKGDVCEYCGAALK